MPQLTLEDALSCWQEVIGDARDSVKKRWSRETHTSCYKPVFRDIAGAAFDAIAPRKSPGRLLHDAGQTIGDRHFGPIVAWDELTPKVRQQWEDDAALRVGPGPLRFECQGLKVLQGTVPVATATSNTMAKRIRNALNFYKPAERGF